MSLVIGCHVSIKHGFDGAAQVALSLGCKVFQYFPKNPRSLAVKSFDAADASRCKNRCIQNQLISVAHTPYPVNLATDHVDLADAIKLSLLNDLAIAEAVGSLGVVVHFGKYTGENLLQGYQNIIKLLDEVLEQWSGEAKLLIENQAGGMGTSLEELAQIRLLCRHPERIGFCFDTCHAFASGLWDGRNWDRVVSRGAELGYFDHLKVIHLNDSRYPSGSNRDYHANIGRGKIGDEALRSFLHSPWIHGVPLVLETPSSSDLSIADELDHVRQLYGRNDD